MLFLFLHFYYTTYVASKHRRALKKVSPAEPHDNGPQKESSPETKSLYINGYIADSPSGYSLRSRKNGSINVNAAAASDKLP